MDAETLVAHHVEALIGLGWRWEGRGLVPSFDAKNLTAFDSQKLASETVNFPLGDEK